jgi:Uma2 family endonuclease
MPRVAVNEQVLTFDQYLEIEASAETRHEFVDGFMFAMAGSTKSHNLIASNIHSRLRAASKKTSCRAYMENVKLRTPDGIGYYPDVILTCDDDITDLVIRTPCLILEVLSKSTSEVDHTEKWLNYQRIPSLNMYVMVAQDRRFLEVYTRQTDGSWRYETLEDAGTLKFACVNASMTLDDVYEDVIFTAAKPADQSDS